MHHQTEGCAHTQLAGYAHAQTDRGLWTYTTSLRAMHLHNQIKKYIIQGFIIRDPF